MGYQRTVSSKFWEDSKVEEFSPEDKYALLYFLTNPLTNLCGCYEIGKKRMSRDLGYNIEAVSVILDRLVSAGVVDYDHKTSELLVVNWGKYNWNKSPKLVKALKSGVAFIKSERLLNRFCGIVEDTLSIPFEYRIDSESHSTSTSSDSISDSVSINNNGGKVENADVPVCPQCHEVLSFDVKQSNFRCKAHGIVANSEVFWK